MIPESALDAVIYARFSTDLQNPKSCADQTAVCRVQAVKEFWNVIRVFADEAVSAKSFDGRSGIQELVA